MTLLGEQGVIELAADCNLEVVAEPDGAKVSVNGLLDLVDCQVRQIADALLPASAQIVEVGAAVATTRSDDEPVATTVAPDDAFEPMVVLALAGTPSAA
nr:hypothetical protein [Actinokineospora spheciospongiae]